MTKLVLDKDFARLHAHGKYFKGKNFRFLYLKNELGAFRFAVAISRKIGNAVTRNRIRRRLTETIKKCKTENLGVDMVIFPYITAKTTKFCLLVQEFASAIESL